MASQEELDRQLAEELQKEELRLLEVSNQSMAHDLEEDRLLAEKLQREEEAEYAEFPKIEAVKSKTPPDVENFKINLPSTSNDNKYQMLSVKHEHLSLVDPVWEQIDPTPDVHALFLAFDNRFFAGHLKSCEVRWSPRMTLCAGLCCFQPRSRFCSIRLSKPLLSLRPRSDLVETLLHEMIHAFLFLTNNNRDRDGHGPEFHKHMYRINKEAGTKITVFHSFHNEVRQFKVHHWRCNGPCKLRPPYFGWVKRSMNRAPGKSDFWWADHQRTCGGEYIKVSGPEKQVKEPKSEKTRNETTKTRAPSPLRKFFKTDGGSSSLSQPGPSRTGVGVAETKTETDDTKLGRPGNQSSAGQTTPGLGNPAIAKQPGSSSTTVGSVSGDGAARQPRGRVSPRSPRQRGRRTPASAPASGSGSSGGPYSPPRRAAVAQLPKTRGGARSGSRVFTVGGMLRKNHVLPTSQPSTRDRALPSSARTGSPGLGFTAFRGAGYVLGGSATRQQSGWTQNLNGLPVSSLLGTVSRTTTGPAPQRKKMVTQLLNLFSDDEDEAPVAPARTSFAPAERKGEKTPIKIEIKEEKEDKSWLKRKFKDEASTSQRVPKVVKREPGSGASTSRQDFNFQEAIVISDNDA